MNKPRLIFKFDLHNIFSSLLQNSYITPVTHIKFLNNINDVKMNNINQDILSQEVYNQIPEDIRENGRRYYEKKNNVTMELKNSRIYLKSRNVRS